MHLGLLGLRLPSGKQEDEHQQEQVCGHLAHAFHLPHRSVVRPNEDRVVARPAQAPFGPTWRKYR
jgi:hypothetical protein